MAIRNFVALTPDPPTTRAGIQLSAIRHRKGAYCSSTTQASEPDADDACDERGVKGHSRGRLRNRVYCQRAQQHDGCQHQTVAGCAPKVLHWKLACNEGEQEVDPVVNECRRPE